MSSPKDDLTLSATQLHRHREASALDANALELFARVVAAYVWLAARAGAVFATQTSYFVTGSGVLWAMLLLGERFSAWVWAALVVMLLGLFLVQPRERSRPVAA